MKNCSTLPIVTSLDSTPARITVQCGRWVTLCGKGQHKVSYFLGQIQAPVTIWFEKENIEDEIYIHQFDEVIAAAPLGVARGSFVFQYAPLNDETGMDEIILVHQGAANGSRIHFRLDCVEDPCLPTDLVAPVLKETWMSCGKYWHQSGYVKRNTITMSDMPGTVDVIWKVDGNAQVEFFQDKTLLKTIRSNREGNFSFYYEPDLGEIYAITQGTGAVDYLFSCPYDDSVVAPPKFEFSCGGVTPYVFQAPQLTNLNLPSTVSGTIDITCTVVETVSIVFLQNNVPFYVLSGHSGTVNFSYDYLPEKGKITINATGYGSVSIFSKCPYVAADPIPTEENASCGTLVNTYPGFSNVTMDMKGIAGKAIIDFIITESEITIVNGSKTQVVRTSGSFEIDYDNGAPLVIQARGNDFQMRVSCPVRTPVNNNQDCGVTRTYTSLSNTIVRYGSTPGNTTITASQNVSVYRDSVLVGVGRDVTFFYPGVGQVLVVCAALDGTVTIAASCPAAKTLPCGNVLQSYTAGEIINVGFAAPLVRGHVNVHVEITGNVSLAFRLGSTTVKTSTTTETFNQIMNPSEGLKIVSTGTGTFKLYVECVVPIYATNVETKTERINCAPGETANGSMTGNTYVTATWTITTYSDGNVVTSAKTYDGVCMVASVPLQPARWGVAMFANKNFTGGPIALDITQEERDYGVVATTSPSGKTYTRWDNVQDFCTKVMTHTFHPTATDNTGQFEPTIAVDDFVYVMWDKRRAEAVQIINMGNSFEVNFEGIWWRNDLLGNYEGLPEYNPNMPIYMTVTFDNGAGPIEWIIVRQETTTLPQYSPRTDKYSVKYLPTT